MTRNMCERARAVALAILLLGMMATPSFAQGEITGVIGGMLGGDLNNILEGNTSIEGAFDNGPLYGVRAGFIGGFFGVEGSFVYSPTGLAISVPTRPLGVDADVYYLEGNVLFLPIPGPISPFVTAGVGYHSYKFDLAAGATSTRIDEVEKLGYNFGGGLKINIKALTFRFDVRDHFMSIGPDDFDISDIAEELGFDDEQWLHNVEISGGVGIRF